MEKFRKEAVAILRKEVGGRGKLTNEAIEALLELPSDPTHGDLAFPCFEMAKEQKKAPPLIAQELAALLKPGDLFESIKPAGGYVNFHIKEAKLAEAVLNAVFEEKDAYGATNRGKQRKVVIEFSSPNIAKPFGIGHLRSTNIGAALARIYKFLNYHVISVNHLGDWGTQFGKIIAAYKHWGKADFLKGDPIMNLYRLYVQFHDEEKKHPELADEAREWFAKLERGDQEATELWNWFREISTLELKSIYAIFDIHFDHQLGESFYTDKMPGTIEQLKTKKLLESSEGAQIVRLEDLKLPPAIIMKSNDSTLYITRDLAAAEYRHKTYKFEKMLYVVGTPQALHFQQLFAVLKKMGHDWADSCEHVGFGHLSFKESAESKAEAMSTRSGNIIFLKDVIERASEMADAIIREKRPDLANRDKVKQQVAIAALLYADFSAKRRKDVKFSWQDILNFDGETGPYLQYTSVRIRSLLEKYTGNVTSKVDFAQLSSREEKELIKQIAHFDETLNQAADENEPFVLAHYVMELAKRYNKFYTKHRVLDQEGETSMARVLLTYCASVTLDSGLKLLGIPVPEKM